MANPFSSGFQPQKPTFGQSSGFGVANQHSTGFGSTNQPSTGFGTINQPTTGFGTVNQQTPGFGSVGGFGSTGSSAFGSNPSNPGGFGTTGTGFSTTGSGFGTTTGTGFSTTTGSGFGTSGSGFGTTGSGFGTTTGTSFGTTGPDLSSKGAGFGTSGGFGTQGSGFGTTGAGFGTAGSSFGTSGGFGTQGGGFGTTGAGFGNPSPTSTATSFGKTPTTSVFGTSSGLGSGAFGPQSQQKGTNLFGNPTTTVSTFGGASSFGASTKGSVFGNQSKTTGTFGGFGTGKSSSTFGGSGFGAVSQGPNVFGAQTSQPPSVFGGVTSQPGPSTQSSVFGGIGTQPGTNPFGSQSTSHGTGTMSTAESKGFGPGTSIFGTGATQSSAASSFGVPSGTSTGIFGQTGTQSATGFSATATSSSAGLFGKNSFGADETAGTSGTSLFGKEDKPGSSKNLFGKPELQIKAQIPELSPPSTVFYPVTSTDTAMGGGKVAQGMNPLFAGVKHFDDGERQKTSSKKMLFGKPTSADTRRSSIDQPGTSKDSYDQTTKRKPSKENDEEPQSKRPIRRMSSTDEMANRVAIVCNHVPNKYNNVFFMRKHFSRFGEVTKVFPNPRKLMTTVHFKTNADAREAKSRGRFLDKGVRPMEIFWSNYTSPAARRRKSSDEADTTPTKRRDSFSSKHTSKSEKFRWAKKELDDELSCMAGTSDVSDEKMKLMDRPEDFTGSPSKNPVRHSSPGPSTSKTAVNVPAKVDIGSVTTLKNTVCTSSADKLQILNLRDKIIRLGMKKTANLKSKAFVGTCTDMCPERERYDREEKRRLHLYEILNPGSQNPQVNHQRAVKEYSRSSADQEEPLPHELRPLSALQLTMNYLLTEIADRGEDGKWGDWFDFLWDRTRGIRKDITQQQLTTPESAELLEKCVRFHIFCSERLCEEDMHVFDLKINNENMTKCLQTLKEFYHDLATKHNTYCKNEAEMRSYMVLMNLNQGDILRETQQLRPEVRNTSFINFAVQVHSAINSNNYVKFFKLVKTASFLPACIMHRYFIQVRTKALLMLIKAYRPKSHFSLVEMVRILGFENKIEARYFCKFHGLNVTDEFVVLDRTSYIDPEESWPPRRAQTLIESKLTTTIGEVINGEALPPLNIPSPINSFNDNGMFIGNLDVNVQDIPETEVKQMAQKEAPKIFQQVQQAEAKPEVKPQKLQYTNDDVKDIAKHLFWDVINDMAKEVSHDMVQGAQMMAAQTQSVCDLIVEEVVTEYVNSLSQSYHSEVSLLKQKKEKEIMIQSSAVHFTSLIIKDVVDQEVLNVATAEVREVKAQLKKEQIERCSDDESADLVKLVLNEMCEEVAEEVYQKDVVERLEELEEICYCIELQRAGRYLKAWKKEYSARVKLKRSMLEFPPAVGMESNTEQKQRLIPARQSDVFDSNGFFVNNLARLKIDTPDKDLTNMWAVDRMLTAHELYRKLCHLKAWQPLDIAATVGSNIQKHFTRCKSNTFYWKLVISLPDQTLCKDPKEQEVAGLLNKWLRSKFTKGKDEMSPSSHDETLLSLYRTKLPYNHHDRVEDLGVCIRSVKDDDLSHSDLLGSNGLIFVLPPGITEDLSSKYWIDASQRLQTMFQLKPSCPAIPLAVIVPVLANEDIDELITQGLNLSSYQAEDLVSSVYLQAVDLLEDGLLDVTQPELNEELCECVQWLAEAYPQQPDLKVKFLSDFIDDVLMRRFYDVVLHNLKLRKENGYLHQYPEQLVQLYNHVVSHIGNVLTSRELKEQSWPVAEFFSAENPNLGIPPSHWNSEDHIDYIEQLIEKLHLPWFLNDDFEKEDWSDICEVVWEYIDKVADTDGQAKVDLCSKIRLILRKTEEDFADICYLLEKETQCEPSSENIPWTDVITACMHYKIATVSFQDAQVDKKFELMAVYFKRDIDIYQPPDRWRYLESEKDVNVTTSMKSSVQIAKDKTKAKKVEQSLMEETHRPSKLQNVLTFDLKNAPESFRAAHKLSLSLSSDLKREQTETQKYEQFLQDALLDGNMNNSNIPDISCLPPWSVFDSPEKSVQGDNALVESLSEPLVSDVADKIKLELDINRRASDIFENQLRQWLGSPV